MKSKIVRPFALAILFLTLGNAVTSSACADGGSEDVRKPLWLFWYHQDGKLYDEMYSSREECENATVNWEKESTLSPIAFRCAEVTRSLLKQARKRCKQKQPLACEWAQNIELYVEHRPT